MDSNVPVSRRALTAGLVSVAILDGTTLPAIADALQDGTFRDEAIAILKKVRPDLKVEPLPDPGMIKAGSGELSLNNIYREVSGLTGPDREEALKGFLTKMLVAVERSTSEKSEQKPLNFEEARPLLRIQIAPIDYVQQFFEKANTKLIHKPLSPEVIVAYAIDAPDTFSYVTVEQLERWKQDASAIHQIALTNLDEVSRKLEIEAKKPKIGLGRYAMISLSDGYAAARCLCPEFMKRITAVLGPTVFLGIPNRDFLVIWSVDFDLKEEFAAQMAYDFNRQPHPLSPELFVYGAQGLRLANAAELEVHGRH